MTDLTKANELLDEVKVLNRIVEESYLTLALKLAQVSELKLYEEAGYGSYAEYVVEELQRPKSFASKMLKDGLFILQNKLDPSALDTTYTRLYGAINLLGEGATAEEVISHATTLSESELITSKKSKDAGVHEHRWACTKCDEEHSCQTS